ncbi:MAG: FtsX-like permease family protein, partial [Bacteroidota bacterium]
IDPIGKTVKTELFHFLPDVDPNFTFIVNGVFRDLPRNSTFELDLLISEESDPKSEEYHFTRFIYYTFVLLREGEDPKAFAPKLSEIYDRYMDPSIERMMTRAIHELVPLKQIHMKETGGYSYIYIFAAVGLLMLLIAIISYINLATAQASKRSMEIGVRKVMGSTRQQLITQFLSESVFFSVLALLFALALLGLVIKPLNTMLGLQLDAEHLLQPHLIVGSLIIVFVIGILGGSYPAFFLSSFQPISVMKGKMTKGVNIRRLLVAIQFTVVIFVLVSTVMIYWQLQYMRNKDLGFDHEQVLRVPLDTADKLGQVDALKAQLQQAPNITSVGTSSFVPGLWMPSRPLSADNAPSREPQYVYYGEIDYDFLETMNISVVKGRNYSEEYASDATQSIIVNQTLVEKFELDNPIGEKVRLGTKDNPEHLVIIGVVEDFHQSSLHTEIASQIFFLEPALHQVSLKVDQNLQEGIAHLERSWNQIYPNEPLEYIFFDEDLATNYETDRTRGKLFILFSGITIFIAFLGLFGLASYIARQRLKEISVRRVLGASIVDIMVLISKDFLLLVTFAAIPAFLIAWYFISQWLQEFAYRAEMNYLLFGLVFIAVLILTCAVTGFHAVRATQLNPAETLKHE